jgi:hypothetical protein
MARHRWRDNWNWPASYVAGSVGSARLTAVHQDIERQAPARLGRDRERHPRHRPKAARCGAPW